MYIHMCAVHREDKLEQLHTVTHYDVCMYVCMYVWTNLLMYVRYY